jgi:hypothetical protein
LRVRPDRHPADICRLAVRNLASRLAPLALNLLRTGGSGLSTQRLTSPQPPEPAPLSLEIGQVRGPRLDVCGRFALPSETQGSVKRDLIRRSRDQRSHALPPGLSQLAPSFIAYQAESFPNRRLRTIPGTPFLLLLQPRKLYVFPELLEDRWCVCCHFTSVANHQRVMA